MRSELTNDPDNRQLREEHELTQNHVKLKMVERSAHRDQMNSNNHFTLSERVNSYFFRRAKKSQSTRTIQKLNISNPDGSIQAIEKENIPEYMRHNYNERIAPNPNAGRLTIQEFLGQELTNTLPSVDQSLHARLTSPITYIEVENLSLIHI